MKILIDATPVLVRSAGVKNFVYYWVAHLKQQAATDTLSVFPLLNDLGRLDHEMNHRSRLAMRVRMDLLGLVNLREYHLIDLLVSRRYDLFHASQQLRNPPRKCCLTATVYDMTCWLMPEVHTPANVTATKEYAERVLQRAHGLIAISECTRNDAIRILGLKENSVEVIYPGVSSAFFDVCEAEIENARKKYALPTSYVLFVGCIEPRKNLSGILRAWNLLPQSLRTESELVVAGPLGWERPEIVARLRAGQNSIRYLGYVPEHDLPAVTAGAAAFVYPSFYEGFGFPVAQAMAAGIPVITSSTSSLPEVAGDAALLVDPHSAGEIGDAMRQVLSSSSLRQTMRTRSLIRAKQFQWSECARRSMRFFHRTAGM